MTNSTVVPAPPAEKPASFWEDLIDIFFQPADVFRRRESASFWPPLLVVAVLLALFTIANANVLQPLIEAEMTRQMNQAMKTNPQFTPAMAERGRAIAEKFQEVVRYGTVVAVPIFALVYGLWIWLFGKLFGSKQTFNAAMVVVSYAFVTRVLESIINAVQGLLMDPSSLTALTKIQISPARFLDPDTANPVLLVLLSRLDVFVIWFWVLAAIGLYVTGRVSRGKAAAFGVLMWVLGALPALRGAYMRM
jgi:hypothetical protein